MIEPGCLASISRRATACATKIGGAHVELHDRVEILDRDVDQHGFGRLVPALLTRMLNGCGLRDRRLHGGEVGHVEHQRLGLARRARGSPPPPPRSRLACAPRASHARRLRQRRRRREPDAAPAAGDERALAVEAEGGGLARSIAAIASPTRGCSLHPRAANGGEVCGGGARRCSASDSRPHRVTLRGGGSARSRKCANIASSHSAACA